MFSINITYVEIYNEVIKDLLTADAPPSGGLKIHEGLGKGLFIGNLTEINVKDEHGVIKAIQEGDGENQLSSFCFGFDLI